jgi:hypothetical protein
LVPERNYNTASSSSSERKRRGKKTIAGNSIKVGREFALLFAYLQSLYAAVGEGVLQPFGELEAFMRQVAVKRQCDAKHASDHIEPRKDSKSIPGEREGRQQAERMHEAYEAAIDHILRGPFPVEEVRTPIPHHHIGHPYVVLP